MLLRCYLYEERCERNVVNAKKRYEKLHPDEQQPPIACHNDNNSDNDNKTDNDDDNADALIISNARVSDYSFETVWTMYGKPVGNVEVLKAKWNSLSAKNKDITVINNNLDANIVLFSLIAT